MFRKHKQKMKKKNTPKPNTRVYVRQIFQWRNCSCGGQFVIDAFDYGLKKSVNINMGNILEHANVNNLSRVKPASGAPTFHSFCQNEFARLPLINHFPSLIWQNCPPLMSRLVKYSFKKYHLPPVWLGSDGKWMLMRCFDYVSPMSIISSIVEVGVPRISFSGKFSKWPGKWSCS